MKRLWIFLLGVFILCGCSTTQTMETVADDIEVMASPATVEIAYFDEGVTALTSDGYDRLYLCDGYAVAVQTFTGGDLERSVYAMTGRSADQLTVINTSRGGLQAYEYVWSAAGEGAEQMCRGILLDDGTYHYAVTVMADYTQAGKLRQTWQTLLDSVTVSTD